MAATIKDIAKQLNISISTVSYALNGGPRSVPKETIDLVFATAKELGYRPNRNARSLITGRSYSIGVVPSNLGHDLALGPYFHSALNGIINRAEDEKHDVLIFTRHDVRDERIMNDLLDGRVDGAIFLAPPKDCPTIEAAHRAGLPQVVLGSVEHPVTNYVVDNVHGATLAMEHLFELGHRRIAHMGGFTTMSDGRLRLETYHACMARRGLSVPETYTIEGQFTISGAYEAGLKLLKQTPRPTAVFCANDEMAFGTIRAAHDLGLSVPSDLSVVGFDDSPMCSYVVPSLTTIRQPITEMAEAALAAVITAVRKEEALTSRQFPAELIVRASTTSPKEDSCTITYIP